MNDNSDHSQLLYESPPAVSMYITQGKRQTQSKTNPSAAPSQSCWGEIGGQQYFSLESLIEIEKTSSNN